MSADASSIFESLKHAYKDLDLHKIVGFFSDGLSVTIRLKKGLNSSILMKQKV